ncbi:MAG: hypothetical protein PHR68_04875 [Candidatus Gracilibacteria bacterium]|nr:hypothetical protein [Candidatus Gracilibacteria bacterium]
MLKKSFKIDNDIYSIDLINKAIIDFIDFVKISYLNSEIIIESNDDDINEIFNEFMNYVVGLYNEAN